MSRGRDFEYAVLGLGGIGSAAAYWLSRRAGTSVLGLEQFELGHVRGESQDHSRIIRLSYHTPGYVRLAKSAYAAWSELERESGDRVVVKTGGIDLFPEGAAIPERDYTESMRAEGVPFELLDAGEAMRTWPQFRLEDSTRAIYQADSGIAAAAVGNAAHQRMARVHGATLLERTPVVSIRDAGGEVELLTAEGTAHRCAKLVIAAGPWSNAVLEGAGVRLPLTVTQEQVTYFDAPNAEAFAPDRFPIWIWMDEPSFYGFPAFGEPGPKVGQDVGGLEVSADARTFEPDAKALQRVEEFLDRVIPGALGPRLYTKTCLYTLTPDRDFVIDAVPGWPNVHVAIGAGHAYKFASLIGRILSELTIDGATEHDLTPFAIDRELLTMADPPTNFLI